MNGYEDEFGEITPRVSVLNEEQHLIFEDVRKHLILASTNAGHVGTRTAERLFNGNRRPYDIAKHCDNLLTAIAHIRVAVRELEGI